MKVQTDLNQLYYFVEVVRHRGFSAASRAIGIPKSRLSRQLTQLEQQLGVKLLQRNTRHFHLTDVGERYFEHCEAMLIEAEAAQSIIDASLAQPRGTLKISCPLLLLDLHVNTVLTQFMLQYPEVKVELESSNRVIDVMAEGFDIAIRARSSLESSDLIAKTFSRRRQVLVAQSLWLSQQQALCQPEDLQALPSLSLGRPHQTFAWNFLHPSEAAISMSHTPRLITSDMNTLLQACLLGLGVVQLPYLLVKPYLEQGLLSHVLPQWQLPEDIIHAVYPSRRGQLPTIKIFLQHLEAFYAHIENEQ